MFLNRVTVVGRRGAGVLTEWVLGWESRGGGVDVGQVSFRSVARDVSEGPLSSHT